MPSAATTRPAPPKRALQAGERALAEDPTDARALSIAAAGLFGAGRAEEAREWLMRSCALEPDEPYIPYNAACGFVRLGEHERALDFLERIDIAAMANCGWMKHDVDLYPLREHPRFRALLARAR